MARKNLEGNVKIHGYESSVGHRILEVLAIVSVLSLCGFQLYRVYGMSAPGGHWVMLAFSLFFGYLLADFASGFVHWLADRYGSVDTPVLGKNYVHPFREHHVLPKKMCEHGFIETNGNNSIVSLPVIGACAFFVPATVGNPWLIFVHGSVTSLIIFIFMTNQAHKWSHMDNPPWYVRFLQKTRIFLDPDHHDVHHTNPFDTNYCITSGWLNWPLQKIRFFPFMEWLIEKTLGIEAGKYGPFIPGVDGPAEEAPKETAQQGA